MDASSFRVSDVPGLLSEYAAVVRDLEESRQRERERGREEMRREIEVRTSES